MKKMSVKTYFEFMLLLEDLERDIIERKRSLKRRYEQDGSPRNPTYEDLKKEYDKKWIEMGGGG